MQQKTSQRGQGMTEYIIVVALVAIAAIGVYTAFGKTVRGQMAVTAQALAGDAADQASVERRRTGRRHHAGATRRSTRQLRPGAVSAVRRPHSGQASVLLVALVASMLACFAVVFSAGQLVNDKMRLVNAADAAAYSAATWEARSLNFQSYMNRAIVANEVALAQLVSLRSWSRYVATASANSARVAQFIPYLAGPARTLAQGWRSIDTTLQSTLPGMEAGISSWNVDVLANAQAVAHQQAPIVAADLVNEVARGPSRAHRSRLPRACSRPAMGPNGRTNSPIDTVAAEVTCVASARCSWIPVTDSPVRAARNCRSPRECWKSPGEEERISLQRTAGAGLILCPRI